MTFAGIKDYADSGVEERPILAAVAYDGADARFRSRSALSLMIPLGASHLLGLLRRMPQYVAPYMEIVDAVGVAILEQEPGADFRVRDQVLTDPEVFAISVAGLGPEAMPEAAVNSALPVVETQLAGKVEREARLRLMVGKRGETPWASYKFRMGSSNPLTTIGAWSAVLEFGVRNWSYEDVALPAAAGMRALVGAWREMGCPPGVPLQISSGLGQLVTEVVLADDPLSGVASL